MNPIRFRSVFQGAWSAARTGLVCSSMGCVILGILIWQVFRPGLLDGDGLGMCVAATSNRYNDWNPPVMSLVLHALIAHGAKWYDLITLAQCVTGCLGIYSLARAVVVFWYEDKLSARYASAAAFAVLLILLSPLFPVMYYLAHFGKDTWAAICLLWIGSVSIRLHMSPVRRPVVFWAVQVLALYALFLLLFQVRYNSILLLPSFCILAFLLLKTIDWRYAILGALVAAVSPFAVDHALHRVFRIERVHAVDQILATELVGMCLMDQRVQEEFPFTAEHLIEPKWRQEYIWGCVEPLMHWWPTGPVVKQGYSMGSHDRLVAEYRKAALEHPGLLARVKAKAFSATLFDDMPFWHHCVIDDNPFGIRLNSRFGKVRNTLLAADQWVQTDRALRWLGGRHLPWLLVTLLAIMILSVRVVQWRSGKIMFTLVIVSMPFLFYVSNALATAHHVFRYMFTATVFVQVCTLAAALGWIFRAYYVMTLLDRGEIAWKVSPTESCCQPQA
ncbi:MAG: hypothetical protein K2R98_13055 [Gemmataceae bacterium]|nr:hypothetical protein [Gemmataceae bacterium]